MKSIMFQTFVLMINSINSTEDSATIEPTTIDGTLIEPTTIDDEPKRANTIEIYWAEDTNRIFNCKQSLSELKIKVTNTIFSWSCTELYVQLITEPNIVKWYRIDRPTIALTLQCNTINTERFGVKKYEDSDDSTVRTATFKSLIYKSLVVYFCIETIEDYIDAFWHGCGCCPNLKIKPYKDDNRMLKLLFKHYGVHELTTEEFSALAFVNFWYFNKEELSDICEASKNAANKTIPRECLELYNEWELATYT